MPLVPEPLLLQLPEDEVLTSTQTVVLSATLPEVPVTSTSYAPVVVEEVVVAVSVEVSAVELVTLTEVGDRLHVVGLEALEGELVIEQLRETVPENELPGVTVMVAVPDEPGATVTLPLFDRLKLVLLALGFCQKSPQPARKTARSGTANIKLRVHPRSLITAPGLAPAVQRAGAGSNLRTEFLE